MFPKNSPMKPTKFTPNPEQTARNNVEPSKRGFTDFSERMISAMKYTHNRPRSAN